MGKYACQYFCSSSCAHPSSWTSDMFLAIPNNKIYAHFIKLQLLILSLAIDCDILGRFSIPDCSIQFKFASSSKAKRTKHKQSLRFLSFLIVLHNCLKWYTYLSNNYALQKFKLKIIAFYRQEAHTKLMIHSIPRYNSYLKIFCIVRVHWIKKGNSRKER